MKLEYKVVLPYGRLANRIAAWALIGAAAVGGPRLLLHLAGGPRQADVLAQWGNLTPDRVFTAFDAMFHPSALVTLAVVALLLPFWFYLALEAYRSRPEAGASGERG